MKKTFIWALLIGVSFMFIACPYHSEVAIDTPTMKIDAKLLGKWQKRTSDDETYIVTKKDENMYKIIEKEKTPTEGQKDKEYNAFLSDVNGTKFLNLYDPTEDTKTYYFYKLDFSDETGGFTLYPVTEYITETFTASGDLKKFVQSNMSLSFFYGSKEEYIKVGK